MTCAATASTVGAVPRRAEASNDAANTAAASPPASVNGNRLAAAHGRHRATAVCTSVRSRSGALTKLHTPSRVRRAPSATTAATRRSVRVAHRCACAAAEARAAVCAAVCATNADTTAAAGRTASAPSCVATATRMAATPTATSCTTTAAPAPLLALVVPPPGTAVYATSKRASIRGTAASALPPLPSAAVAGGRRTVSPTRMAAPRSHPPTPSSVAASRNAATSACSTTSSCSSAMVTSVPTSAVTIPTVASPSPPSSASCRATPAAAGSVAGAVTS